MKKFTLYIVAMAILFLTFSCEDNQVNPLVNKQLIDTWLLFERGYSPGAGYITDQVSPDPAQTMSFQSDGQFSSNIDGLQDFKYYSVIQDSTQEILALHEKVPTPADQELENLVHSYAIEFTEDAVKLYFRWCFEGCHLALRPIDQSN